MASNKVYNFAAGPSKLPEEVVQQIHKELLNFDNTNITVMELSHRSPNFQRVVKEADTDLRQLLNVPDNYTILFLQGGGTGQFSSVPLNLCSTVDESADYLVTGSWSANAAKEAEKYCKVNRILNSNNDYSHLPTDYKSKLNPNARYVYYCSNETVHGVEWPAAGPEVHPNQLLVADMSSNFLTRQIDVSKHAVIFAGAQKNCGISGVTVVIVRSDLLNQANPMVPNICHYKQQAANNSMLNTPPCFPLYVTRLCFAWMIRIGGVAALEKQNELKSKAVYEAIESSNGFYQSTVRKGSQSRVNIPLRIQGGNDELEKRFLAEAEKNNMIQLKGHRSVGGIRVSIYNAITLQETLDFVQFLNDFRQKNSN